MISLRHQSRKGPHLAWRGESARFSLVRQVPLELRWGPQGPTRLASGKASLHVGHEGPLMISLQSVLGPKSSSGAETGH